MRLYQILEKQLKKEPNYVTDSGELKKWVVISKAQNGDPELIESLLKNNELKEKFFMRVNNALVFNTSLFLQFLEQKNYLNDSYTQYKNKVGLTIDGKYLKQRNEVALVWPFKDCILEGGQSKEEDKREEIFFNEILAQDEITQLLEPKVLTNAHRYTAKGKKSLDKFNRNQEGTITDNLIIKGNNLLALHSLQKEFACKVKLIYIDPPYNTGNDSFKYNDTFNESTWLTFMKNRLTVAKLFLSESGVIFVHCDNNEQAELKILLDEIFEKEQFIETITVVNNPRGRDYGGIANMHEYIHVFAKNQFEYKMFRLVDEEKKFPYLDAHGGFEIRELRNRNTVFNDKNRPNLCYPFYVNPKKKLDNDFLELSLELKKGFIEVWPAKSNGIQTVWRWGKEKAMENLNISIAGKAMQEEGRYMIIEKYRDNSRLARSVWWDKEVNSERGTVHLRELFGNKVFNFPKPETLLSRIIQISTNEGDIVMDFHLGSGTTASTAHKMMRQYIGIEQMDYIEDVAVPRLNKVISGEKGGISSAVNWQGGGEFVYLELKKYNQNFLDKIERAKDTKTLLNIWKEMKAKSFLNYNVDIKRQDENINEFKALTLKKQKQHLCEILDKNQLYVNLSSLNDKDFLCTDHEKEITKSFYKLEI
ncbi:MAG: site-specific DNA-methyltransferase [Candidatus Methanofastidiosa archaeon]|nr:site-specific DNA-methyltransferase [Candidatus Methanofastidiosa archaeon]